MTLNALKWNTQFDQLGRDYSAVVDAQPLSNTRLLHFNHSLGTELGIKLTPENRAEILAQLSGEKAVTGQKFLAHVYSGHQFGQYVPQLGDGRAMLIGQIETRQNALWELQLKGAGQTPFSRFGDGRAVLRSSIREYLASEAMHGLGIPTTRALALFHSDEKIQRETIESGALIVRVAPSHIRFGSFEYFYYQHKHEKLKPLADYVIEHYFPQFSEEFTGPKFSGKADYAGWLQEVVKRTAELVASWQTVGFCHGVMNTDNMSILGLTLDYGPFGFIDGFNAKHICNHSDESGRYAYDQQPGVAYWNCSRLLQATLPLLSDKPDEAVERAQEILTTFEPTYTKALQSRWFAKLGLLETKDIDTVLVNDLLALMHGARADFTRTFRMLAEVKAKSEQPISLRDHFADVEGLDVWLFNYRERLVSESSDDDARKIRMNSVNPKFVLRNHLAQRAIELAQNDDASEIENLLSVLKAPFDEHPKFEHYAAEPTAEQQNIELSCSS